MMMQLMAPTTMNASRQARNASPSSDRRTPGAAAINSDLFNGQGIGDVVVLPMFVTTVYLSRVNLNRVHRDNPGGDTKKSGPKSFVLTRFLRASRLPPGIGAGPTSLENVMVRLTRRGRAL